MKGNEIKPISFDFREKGMSLVFKKLGTTGLIMLMLFIYSPFYIKLNSNKILIIYNFY